MPNFQIVSTTHLFGGKIVSVVGLYDTWLEMLGSLVQHVDRLMETVPIAQRYLYDVVIPHDISEEMLAIHEIHQHLKDKEEVLMFEKMLLKIGGKVFDGNMPTFEMAIEKVPEAGA
jgi:hypothetical protein